MERGTEDSIICHGASHKQRFIPRWCTCFQWYSCSTAKPRAERGGGPRPVSAYLPHAQTSAMMVQVLSVLFLKL